MKQTLELLRIIGSPLISETGKEPPETFSETIGLYNLAKRNRMSLLYLATLDKWDKIGKLEKTYDAMCEKSSKTNYAFLRTSHILGNANVPHAIFKTIRPYQYTTVDIDVIIFGAQKEYERSVKTMIESGYKRLGAGPNSTTVRDSSIGMGIDLYKEVAVSHIIYLNKEKIRPYAIKREIVPSADPVVTLSPSADLVALIAHSVIKEHMYTLSEYFSTVYFLAQMSAEELEDFVKIVYANNIVNAARVHLGITTKLHEMAHGNIPEKVHRIMTRIEPQPIETRKLDKNYEAPYRYEALTVAEALLERIRKEEKSRRSLGKQILSMLNPSFAGKVAQDIVNHVFRETY